jgi:membrane protein DedA with SNARE-associated domain/membrane-associated phospholipid phosphatase
VSRAKSWLQGNRVWVRRGLIAAAVVALVVLRQLLPDVNLEHVIEDLSHGLGAWTYLLVAALAFLETGAFVGLIAPGEFTVILGGAVAGQGDISLPLILTITWIAAFLGDTVSFTMGSRLGRGFLIRHGERVRISEDRLKQVEGYFHRHGGKTILIGRFIGLVRALAPFIAGTSGMRYRAFAPYSILGTGLWSATFILVGYFASQSLDKVAKIVSHGLLFFGLFVGLVVGLIVVWRFLREPENRARVVADIEKRRVLRPAVALARRLKPQAVFLWRRLTPGQGLGLELTTLLAVAAVGLYVLIVYWSVINGDLGPTALDRASLDFVNRIRSSWLDDVARTVTDLGSLPVVFSIAAVSAVGLAAKRRWAELWVLLVGVAVIAFVPAVIKDLTDRPRPLAPLDDTTRNTAFPSGHATASTIYVWLAATVAVRLVPGFTRRTMLIVAGIVVTALIGLSRVYLRVHWMSDVLAGWGLGMAAFSLAAALALVVVHIRGILRRDEPA